MVSIARPRAEVDLRQSLPGITAGLIAGLPLISIELSLAALIWSGPLEPFLARGVGLMLFGAFAMSIIVAVTTSVPGMVALPQDTPAAILALMAAEIAASMQAASPEALYSTVVAAFAATTLLMALFFLAVGWFKGSGLVRYIPYPVVGGFLAGTGWLLAKGGLGVMANMPLTLSNLPQLFAAESLLRWLPGFAFGAALLLALRRWKHFLVMPAALLLSVGLFYGWLVVAGVPVSQAEAQGWLLGPLPAGSLYRPLLPADLASVDWRVILVHADKIATILVLSMISLLLNASGLEISLRRDIQLDRELLTAGLANLAAGLGGSTVGYHALSLSSLSQRLGARNRLANWVLALLCGAALLFGAGALSYVPRLALGGLLTFLGLSFLVEWLVDARRSLPLVDYLLVWLILVVIVTLGFLQGIAAGVLIAAILFVISYSRVNVVHNVLNGRNFHSNVDRPRLHRELLEKQGGSIYILRLEGFIFFGTVQRILEQVRLRLADPAQAPLRYLVLDFQRVARLDSSAVFGITRIKQLAMSHGIWMVWTQVSPGIQAQLERAGLVDASDDSFVILPTLDHGMEWCENRILGEQGITDLTGFIERMQAQLKAALPGLQDVSRLMKYLERQDVPAGEYLVHQGDPSSEMYFVEAGLLNIQLEGTDGQVLRLRSVRGGATVGEMGLYLGTPRTASVVASRPSAVYRLSAAALDEMRRNDPEVSALLHEWIARLLAERLTQNNRTIEALMG